MPSSRGPRPCPVDRWQVLHPSCWNSFWPFDASDPSVGPPLSQASYSDGSITYTHPIIPEWLVPQYSAQNRWYWPGFVARNQVVLNRPGTTSAFIRKAGIKKL